MTDRVEARCDLGHLAEAKLPMDFDDMDVVAKLVVPGICPTCGHPLSLQRGHYEIVDGLLRWIRPLDVN